VRNARRIVVSGSILDVDDGFGGSIAYLRGSFYASEPSSVAMLVQYWVVVLKTRRSVPHFFGARPWHWTLRKSSHEHGRHANKHESTPPAIHCVASPLPVLYNPQLKTTTVLSYRLKTEGATESSAAPPQ
jgi:hypothetical protein